MKEYLGVDILLYFKIDLQKPSIKFTRSVSTVRQNYFRRTAYNHNNHDFGDK